MKDAPRYLKELGRQVESAPPPEDAAKRRRTMIAAIETSARSTRKTAQAKRQKGRTLAIFAAAAAALAILFGASQLEFSGAGNETAQQGPRTEEVAFGQAPEPRKGDAEDNTKSAPASQAESATARLVSGALKSETLGALEAGDRLGKGRLSADGENQAVVQLASAALVRTAPRSALRVHADRSAGVTSEWLELETGAVTLDVPHLGSKRRLLVKTGEALVEVRGTAFTVSRETTDRSRGQTRVEVSEGMVSVRTPEEEVFLKAGDVWSSADLQGESEASQESPAPQQIQAAASRKETPASSSSPAPAAPTPSSNLAEQNRLYQSALLASRNGFEDLARQRFEQLLREYPKSPLAPGARRELLQLNSSPRP